MQAKVQARWSVNSEMDTLQLQGSNEPLLDMRSRVWPALHSEMLYLLSLSEESTHLLNNAFAGAAFHKNPAHALKEGLGDG